MKLNKKNQLSFKNVTNLRLESISITIRHYNIRMQLLKLMEHVMIYESIHFKIRLKIHDHVIEVLQLKKEFQQLIFINLPIILQVEDLSLEIFKMKWNNEDFT